MPPPSLQPPHFCITYLTVRSSPSGCESTLQFQLWQTHYVVTLQEIRASQAKYTSACTLVRLGFAVKMDNFIDKKIDLSVLKATDPKYKRGL